MEKIQYRHFFVGILLREYIKDKFNLSYTNAHKIGKWILIL
jgi:hypothetical protein